jgi:tetratricopeptide (TPR) repeat protein
MRPWAFVASCVLVLGGSLSGMAQRPTGPATLENLLTDEVVAPAKRPVAVDATDPAAAIPLPNGRIQGAVTRPKDGVQHPDLDKAWAEYDAVVAKAAEGIKAAINKQFDAATAKGDLDAAEKWQAALEKFEQAGEVPADTATKAAVGAAVAEYKKATDQLSKAYEAVVKTLTIEKKIAEAKTVRGEGVAVIGVQAHQDAGKKEQKLNDDVATRILTLFIGRWRFENGNVEEIAPGGVYLINGNPLDPWGGRWRLDLSDPRGPCVVRHANNGTLTHWYIDPESPNVLVSEKGGKITRIGTPPVNSPEPQGTPPVADAADSGPKRPAGTFARPKDGVQHPDLDKAWAEYDAVVAKAAESIKAAISKQFDATTAKGDLDAAEKWQTALENFEKAGEVPAEKEIKSAASSAVADYKKAKEELGKAYESVVKALTMEKKIAEAKVARDEWAAVGQSGRAEALGGKKGEQAEIAPKRQKPESDDQLSQFLMNTKWRFADGKILHLRPDGTVDKSWGRLHPKWIVKNMMLVYEGKQLQFSSDFQAVQEITGTSELKGVGQLLR